MSGATPRHGTWTSPSSSPTAGSGCRSRTTGSGSTAAGSRGDDGQSLGLPGMTERARLIGGQLRVVVRGGPRTVVDVRVPVGA